MTILHDPDKKKRETEQKDEILDTRAVSKILGCNQTDVVQCTRRLVAPLTVFTRDGRRYYFLRSDVEAFMKGRQSWKLTDEENKVAQGRKRRPPYTKTIRVVKTIEKRDWTSTLTIVGIFYIITSLLVYLYQRLQ